jgi:hypothetical protein
MYDEKLCGANIIDYCSSLPGTVCIVVKFEGTDGTLELNESMFRRFLSSVSRQTNEVIKTNLTVLVDTTATSENTNTAINKVQLYVKSLWDEDYPQV